MKLQQDWERTQKNQKDKELKIDNKINQSVNKILYNVVFKKEDLQNKIYFKNLLNNAIKNYSGQIIFLGSTILL